MPDTGPPGAGRARRHDPIDRFDTAGEVPREPAVSAAVVGFFVRTLVQHEPLAQPAA